MPIPGIFHRQKRDAESTPREEITDESPESSLVQPTSGIADRSIEVPNSIQSSQSPVPENKEEPAKTYLKAMPLRDLADLDAIKAEVANGNILILKITPLANKSIDDVKRAVNDLYDFAESINGDIARLGEERVVLCPPKIRIWREKKPEPDEPLPTAA